MLTVCGSLQATSANRAALEAASAVAVAAGALVDDFELLAEIPPFNADLDAAGGVAVDEWRRRVASADVVLVALPEYAGAVAGVVKNAFDWLVGSGGLYRTPVAVLSAATSGGRHARRMLVQSLTWQGAYVVDHLGIAAPRTKFDRAGRLTDGETATAIESLTQRLLAAAAAPSTDVVARARDVAGRLGIDVAHVAPAGWGPEPPATDALAPSPLRAVPSGPERDTYLPLLRLADDSEEQIQGYYQMGTLLALDDDGGTPLGIVLALDGPEGSADGTAELKAVAVAASQQSQGVGRRMLDDALQWLRARGVRRVIVGTPALARASSPSTRRPVSASSGSSATTSPRAAAMRPMPSRTASRCATWSGWTSRSRRRTARARPRRPAGRARRCRSWGGAAWTWHAPRSGGCAPG